MAPRQGGWTLRLAALASEFLATAAVNLRAASLFRANEDLALRLENVLGVQYHGHFGVGQQTLPVIYDTGSFEIVILSKLCGEVCIHGKTVYDSNLSTSFVAAEEMMKVHYGSGSATSKKGFEAVKIGDPDSPYSVDKIAFWQVVEHQIAVWNRAKFSGIIGLSYLDYVPEGFRGKVEGADEANNQTSHDKLLLAKMGIRAFAVCLERGGIHPPGQLVLGPTVESYTTNPDFATVDVVGKVHWGLKMTGVLTDTPAERSLNISNPCNPSCGAIVDSGTSFIAVPPSAKPMVQAIEAVLQQNCLNVKKLPVLRFEFDGVIAELPPQAYVVRVANFCSTAFMDMDSTSQFGPVWILGMPFFRWHYTVFNRAERKIHFARSTTKCGIEETSQPGAGQHFGAATGGMYLRRTFAADDFGPLEADPSAAVPPRPALLHGF